MKIRILKQTQLGSTIVRVGEVVEASPTESQFLIGIGKAERVIDEPSKAEEPIVTTEAEIPKPKPRKTSTRRRKVQ
jgi:hypothetical protein